MEGRVAIVGGGISGLAAAHALATKHPGIEVRLFEASSRLGGNVRTLRKDGFVIDEGPDSWVSSKPSLTQLARAVGLGDRLIETVPENRRVYVRVKGGLEPLPEGLVLGIPTRLLPLVTTPLVSWKGKLRAGLDLVLPKGFARTGGEDEALGDFVRRRLGQEVLDQLVGPLLGGLFTGDVSTLSLLGTFPQIADLEAQGGLIRGALAQARRMPKRKDGQKPSGFTSLAGGVGDVVDAIDAKLASVRQGGPIVHRDAPVRGLARRDGRWFVESDRAADEGFDHVLLTGPAHVAASLLRPSSEVVAHELDGIPYGSAATVFLAFAQSDVAHRLDATGYLVPLSVRRHAMASTWVNSKWAGRAPPGLVLLRVFFGAADVDRPDDELVELARTELAESVGARGEPRLVHVARFRRASPQPRVGHPARLRRIAAALAALPGVHLAGSAYDGVGLPDCVRQAEQVVARIAERPRFSEAAPANAASSG